MEGEKRCRSKSVSLKPFAANLCYSLPNIRRQDSIIIYLQTIQLITKHYVNAATERIVLLHCFRPDPATVFEIYSYSIIVVSIFRV